eukprot:scaffold121065_cov75-Phaeocystis_antarctica.AAC.3
MRARVSSAQAYSVACAVSIPCDPIEPPTRGRHLGRTCSSCWSSSAVQTILITPSRSLSCSVARGISSMLVSSSSSYFGSATTALFSLDSASGPCMNARTCAAEWSGESRLSAA